MMVAPLDIRPRDGASGFGPADAAVSQWRAIDAALSPIVGSQGVVALYRRSLYLASKTHPWLAHESRIDATAIDLATLRNLLVGRDAADAIAASTVLIHTFMELLASLVGVSLTERLLGPIVAQSLGGTPAQDTST